MYKNKVVFVTGTSNGIGNSIAKEYAKQNANVIAIDIVEHDFSKSNIEFYKADLRNEDEIKSVFEKVMELEDKMNGW